MTKESQDLAVIKMVNSRFEDISKLAEPMSKQASADTVKRLLPILLGTGIGAGAGKLYGEDKYDTGLGAVAGAGIGAGISALTTPTSNLNGIQPIDPGGTFATSWEIPAAAAGVGLLKNVQSKGLMNKDEMLHEILNRERAALRSTKGVAKRRFSFLPLGDTARMRGHIGDIIRSGDKAKINFSNEEIINSLKDPAKNPLIIPRTKSTAPRLAVKTPKNLKELGFKAPTMGTLSRLLAGGGSLAVGLHGASNTVGGVLNNDWSKTVKGISQGALSGSLLHSAYKGRFSKGSKKTALAALAGILAMDTYRYATNKGLRAGAVRRLNTKGFLRAFLSNPTAAIAGVAGKVMGE